MAGRNDSLRILGDDGSPLNYSAKLHEYRSQLTSSVDWQSHMSKGGWLSPRMRELVVTTAHCSADDDCCDDGHYMRFIPYSIRSQMQCSENKFLSGFQHVMYKIGDTFRTRRNPTAESIREKIYGHYDEYDYRGPAKGYFASGGTIEHAIDAVLKMAKISVDDGEFDEMMQDSGEDLPSTRVDEDFDLVRIMCFGREYFEEEDEFIDPEFRGLAFEEMMELQAARIHNREEMKEKQASKENALPKEYKSVRPVAHNSDDWCAKLRFQLEAEAPTHQQARERNTQTTKLALGKNHRSGVASMGGKSVGYTVPTENPRGPSPQEMNSKKQQTLKALVRSLEEQFHHPVGRVSPESRSVRAARWTEILEYKAHIREQENKLTGNVR